MHDFCGIDIFHYDNVMPNVHLMNKNECLRLRDIITTCLTQSLKNQTHEKVRHPKEKKKNFQTLRPRDSYYTSLALCSLKPCGLSETDTISMGLIEDL